MIGLYKLQKEIYCNKVGRGFNVTDIEKEIVLMIELQLELWRICYTAYQLP
jgi:hypothetical protein